MVTKQFTFSRPFLLCLVIFLFSACKVLGSEASNTGLDATVDSFNPIEAESNAPTQQENIGVPSTVVLPDYREIRKSVSFLTEWNFEQEKATEGFTCHILYKVICYAHKYSKIGPFSYKDVYFRGDESILIKDIKDSPLVASSKNTSLPSSRAVKRQKELSTQFNDSLVKLIEFLQENGGEECKNSKFLNGDVIPFYSTTKYKTPTHGATMLIRISQHAKDFVHQTLFEERDTMVENASIRRKLLFRPAVDGFLGESFDQLLMRVGTKGAKDQLPLHHFFYSTNIFLISSVLKTVISFLQNIYKSNNFGSGKQKGFVICWDNLAIKPDGSVVIMEYAAPNMAGKYVQDPIGAYNAFAEDLKLFYFTDFNACQGGPFVLKDFITRLLVVKSLDDVDALLQNHNLFRFASSFKIVKEEINSKISRKIEFKDIVPMLPKIPQFSEKMEELQLYISNSNLQPINPLQIIDLTVSKLDIEKISHDLTEIQRIYIEQRLRMPGIMPLPQVENGTDMKINYFIDSGYVPIFSNSQEQFHFSEKLNCTNLFGITVQLVSFLAELEKIGSFHGNIDQHSILIGEYAAPQDLKNTIYFATLAYPTISHLLQPSEFVSSSIAEDLLILQSFLVKLDSFCQCVAIQILSEFESAIDALNFLNNFFVFADTN